MYKKKTIRMLEKLQGLFLIYLDCGCRVDHAHRDEIEKYIKGK